MRAAGIQKILAAFALLIIAAAVFSGCAVGRDGLRAVRGRGEMISREIQAEDFTGLVIEGGYSLIFRQSEDFSVTVVMQENLFEHLETYVTGGVLSISSTRNFLTGTGNTPRLLIYAPYIGFLTVSGAVDADIELDTESLRINVSGAADLTLSGSVETLEITASGAANINAFGMTAQTAYVTLTGAGSAEVFATETLDATISGAGEIIYDGNPEVTRRISGIGRIVSRN